MKYNSTDLIVIRFIVNILKTQKETVSLPKKKTQGNKYKAKMFITKKCWI